MDFQSLNGDLNKLQQMINSKINIKSIAKHNHPPMTGLLDTCAYCNLHGNVFLKGAIQISNTDDINDTFFSVPSK